MFWRLSVCGFCFAAAAAFGQLQQQTLKLVDGSTIVGRIVAPKNEYLQVALDTGSTTPAITNVQWARLSQETLRALLTNRTAAPFATIFLDPPPQGRPTTAARRINLKQPPRLDRPQGGSLLASPVMLVLLLIIYAANIYAGWEIGVFRQWPAAMVAVIAAVVPIVGPAIFLAMPTHYAKTEEVPLETAPVEGEVAAVVEEAAPAPIPMQAAQPAVEQPIVYPRGQFTFNRRFFETKFAGFLKMVPGEAERDKVIFIKSARGEYTGHRFSKVEPNEVYLQVRKGAATEDVMIPFSEIYEVHIKHKDA
jgi:hypothetical protein